MQQKRCPNFDCFDLVFGSSPSVNPVSPTEVGSGGNDDVEPDTQDTAVDADTDESQGDAQAATGGDVAAAASAAAAVAATGGAVKPAASAAQAATGGAVKPAASAAQAATATAGKAAAAFHLAPSKKEKKLDLGEAYLKAQQSRIESQAAAAQAKNRCDLVIALTLQGKTAEEIATFLQLLGL